jgi:hypothetical protein
METPVLRTHPRTTFERELGRNATLIRQSRDFIRAPKRAATPRLPALAAWEKAVVRYDFKMAVYLVVFASTDRRHVAAKGTACIRCLLNIFNGKGSR